MTGKRIGYIRVSTYEQNPGRQLDGIPLDKKFVEFASAKSTNRPQLQLMLDFVREDDIILVHSMDRLARNVRDLHQLVDHLIEKKVQVQFIKENLTFNGNDCSMSRFMLSMFGAFAEFEYAFIRERQREGIAEAKKAGKYLGGKKKLDDEKLAAIVHRLNTTRDSKNKIAKDFGVHRRTLYKYLKETGK
jgi:DNA invertase Pin-like site-specific DNA recombinase